MGGVSSFETTGKPSIRWVKAFGVWPAGEEYSQPLTYCKEPWFSSVNDARFVAKTLGKMAIVFSLLGRNFSNKSVWMPLKK